MKKKTYRIVTVILAVLAICIGAMCFNGCSKSSDALKDGYYTAEMAEYSHGWKEYLTVFIRGGKIVSAEYNARNVSGFIKSWDMDYMRAMNAVTGTYPNQYTRNYAKQLLEKQQADAVDAIAGATTSYGSFGDLAQAVIDHAKTGNTEIAIVSASAQ